MIPCRAENVPHLTNPRAQELREIGSFRGAIGRSPEAGQTYRGPFNHFRKACRSSAVIISIAS